MKFYTAKCERYILSIFRVLLDRVKFVVISWLNTSCCDVLWQENGNFQITKQYFTYVISTWLLAFKNTEGDYQCI